MGNAVGPIASTLVAAFPSVGGITVSGSLPTPMVVGGFYSANFAASGGTGPYTYSATGLPTGLSINGASGVVSGTVTAVGSYTATVTATDSLLATGSTSPMPVAVVAFPAFNYDFPNPRGKPWPSDVRVGWTWPVPLPTGSLSNYYLKSSKFISYGVLAPKMNALSTSKFISYAALAPPIASLNASKFIAYAILQPIPYYIQRVYENPQPIPPGKWSFLRRWESGPPLPLQTTPYHPFGAQEFPVRFALKRTMGWTQNGIQETVRDTGFVYLICYQ